MNPINRKVVPLRPKQSEEEGWKLIEWSCAAMALVVLAALAVIAHEMVVYYVSKWMW